MMAAGVFEVGGEGEVKWTAGSVAGRSSAVSTVRATPWIGFLALGLSVVPLSVLVIIASRAGKLRAALEAEQELGRDEEPLRQQRLA